MKINTYQPLMHDRAKITRTIAQFWDNTSEGFMAIWGPHFHHGYYENSSLLTPLKAQEKLIQKLAEKLNIAPRDTILDVGCGIGGSSLYLAEKYRALVTGITLSQKQIALANARALSLHNTNVSFKQEDALSMKTFANDSFDLIWSLESCEQFYDKNLFVKQALRVLKPGGKLMLATWCSDRNEYEGRLAKKYKKLCHAFDLPYMPTIEHYKALLEINQFVVQDTFDWSRQVLKSWEIGLPLVNAYTLLQLLKMGGWRGFRFAKQVKLMKQAFEQQRVRYGVFIASKPI